MRNTQNKTTLRFPWLFPFLADFAAIIAAYCTTFFLRFHSDLGGAVFEAIPALIGTEPTGAIGSGLEAFYIQSAFRLILILTAVLCTLYALRNLYECRRFLIERPIAWDVTVANAIALGIFYSYWYLKRNVYHPRSLFASILFFNVFFCIVFRNAIAAMQMWIRETFNTDRCRAVIAGCGEEARFIASLLEIRHPHGIYAASTIETTPDTPFDEQLKVIGDAIKCNNAEMLICAYNSLSVANIMQILEMTQEAAIPTKILSKELNVLVTHARLPCDLIHGVPLVHFDAPSQKRRIGSIRHLLTLAIATVSLIIFTPIMLLIGLFVRLTSHGPAIFVQERLGVNRKPFRLYKFRTMHNQAEELQAQIEEFNESAGALFKIKKDPRITPLGRILRRFSLDELPQLFNVLKGDMVIVGPRPLPRRDFENYYEEWHYSRHGGLPGLTCLWQISGRSNINFHNMCILDVYYLRNHNWILDLKIAIRTIRVVLFGEGAY